jgi:hypothetical protein
LALIESLVRCLSCNYDLRNLPDNRCPECGREFDPNDASTFLDPVSRRKRLWIEALIVCALTYVLLLTQCLLSGFREQNELQSFSRAGGFAFSPDPPSLLIVRAGVQALLLCLIGVPIMLLLYFALRFVLGWLIWTVRYIRLERTRA